MRFLASVRWRLFFVAWIVFSVHFATNVEREHYPAFTLAERFSLQVDEYQGFHSDIFVHTDGHSYIGNNVAVSYLAAIPLSVFDPVLDALERRSKRSLAETDQPVYTEYRTFDHHPNRKAFFKLVKERGLDLRFGASTAITTVFLMAPLSALMVVLMFHLLNARGLSRKKALLLAVLFGFGTPVLFRTASLNHNMFVMYATFGAFALLWTGRKEDGSIEAWRRGVAGLLCGFALAVDYSGVVPLLCVYGYLIVRRLSTADWAHSLRESLVFVAGSVPPVLFLLYTQQLMFGNPFLPGQYWMPEVNFTDQGWRGFSWPSPDLLFLNLFHPAYGLLLFGPLLALGFLPTGRYSEGSLVLPRPERRFVIALTLSFLLFCAANQYSRMQWNTGVRYLLPLVPFLYLAAADHLSRVPRAWLATISVVAFLHSWVLTVFRESVPLSWTTFVREGLQLPWLRVLRLTSPEDAAVVSSPFLPLAILALTAVIVYGLWKVGARSEAAGNGDP